MIVERLVTVSELVRRGILKRGAAYGMARAGLIPIYRVGRTRRGIRFRVGEVIDALRQSAVRGK